MIDNEKPLEGQDQPSTPSEGETPEGQPKGRTAEDRIDELLSKNKEMLEKLEERDEKVTELEERLNQMPVPTPLPSIPQSPDVQKAIDFLKKEGKFIDAQELESRLKGVQDRMYLDSEHIRLETKLHGEDGKPKYDRAKVEEFMRQRGIYDAETAYEKLYRTELLDWEIKKFETDRKKKPYIAQTKSTAGSEAEEQTITREKVAEWIKTPEGRLRYEHNRSKILQLLAEGKF